MNERRPSVRAPKPLGMRDKEDAMVQKRGDGLNAPCPVLVSSRVRLAPLIGVIGEVVIEPRGLHNGLKQ